MKAVVLAGGLGTRLRETVPNLPKPMAPVAGRPFLEYLLDHLIAGGINEMILSVGYRAESIEAHFGHRYRGATLRYAIEDEPLGTGGAIVHALRGEGPDPVLVLNGDTFLNIDVGALIRWYQSAPSQVAMVLRETPDVSRYGAVMLTGDSVTGFAEKGKTGPGLINAGLYVVMPEVLAAPGLPETFSFEADILQRHCDTLRPRAYVTDAYFIDIGVPEDFSRAQRELPAIAAQ